MSVPPGYKATEVGVIPEDWEATSLRSLNPFITSGSRGWAKYYAETGDAFVRITNLSRHNIYPDMDDLRRVKLPDGENEGTRTGLRNGDVLVSITADIGIIGYVDDRVPKPAYINQHIATVRVDPKDADSKFLSYFLATEGSQRRVRATTDAGAKAGMSLSGVGNLLVACPPTVAEQAAIAEALSDVDEAIAAQEAVIAKKRALKTATMQALLSGTRRLPGFSGEWDVKAFGQIATIRNNKVQTRGSGDAKFCVELEHIESGSGELGSWADATGRTTMKYRFLPSDVLFGRLRPYLRKFWYADRVGVCSTEIWPLIPKAGEITPAYLYQIIQTEQFIEAASTAYGTHMPRADWKFLDQAEIYLPTDVLEQAAIAEILKDMEGDVRDSHAKLAKLNRLKTGMMQQLLTGKIRLV